MVKLVGKARSGAVVTGAGLLLSGRSDNCRDQSSAVSCRQSGVTRPPTLVAMSSVSQASLTSPAPACRRANLGTVTAHEAGYFPLRFDCVLADGTTRSAGVVSWWLTPVALVLTASGVGLSVDQHRKPVARIVKRQAADRPAS